MTDEQTAEAVHWLLDSRDPDVERLVRSVQESLGVDLIEWANVAPEEVWELYQAALDLVEQAPLEDTLSFTTARRLTDG